MKRPDLQAALEPLKPFQRRTVDHAFHHLFEAPDSTGRFLVADEVGLGKTLVARGIIARANLIQDAANCLYHFNIGHLIVPADVINLAVIPFVFPIEFDLDLLRLIAISCIAVACLRSLIVS